MPARHHPIAAAALLLAGSAIPAAAHPHVWVQARSAIVYGPDGRVTGIRHDWTFDEAYSAFAIQGLDKGADGAIKPDKLAELARTNVESLAEFNYFTTSKANGQKVSFAPPTDYRVTVDGSAVTLRFLLPLSAPAKADRVFTLDVYDPTAFVDFAIAPGDDAVRLVDAPKGCALRVQRPKPIDTSESAKLGEAFFSALTATATYGVQFASRALVACP